MALPSDPPSAAARFGRVCVVINTGSGGVDARAPARLEALLGVHGVEASQRVASGRAVGPALDAAVAERPDTLIVLGGDGTLASAADLCGPGGPRLMALPGGTMNLLPHALNGRRSWPDALQALLETGQPVQASGGSVAGRRFYVNAILGAPALLADAREAMRSGKLRLAALRFRRAWLRAFKGRLRFSLDGGAREKAGALSLICPLVSRQRYDEPGLEAAALDPHGALDLFRLGMGALLGAWREDPAVRVRVIGRATASAGGRIPAVLDGEPHRLDGPVSVVFHPDAFCAWATADAPALDAARPSPVGASVDRAHVAVAPSLAPVG
jgi:diacylglycerol kinase family enzyme